MIHRLWKGLLLVAVIGAGWSLVQGETKESLKIGNEQHAALMRAKLASSQKIVEGLVSKNFLEIRAGAEELRKICSATEWPSHSDQVYAHHRKELIRQADKIIDASNDQNLDGATYSYVHGLTTCINCHEYCRDVLKIARQEGHQKIVPIPTTDPDDVPRIEQSRRK